MNFQVSPKLRRNFSRILPFGVIWLIISWVFLLNDISLTRYQNPNPETDITLSIPILIFANIMVFVAGILVGTLEVIVLEKVFQRFSLGRKILFKFITYLIIILMIITIAYPIAASLEAQASIFDSVVWEKTGRFFLSLTFLNTLVQLSFQLLISLLYAAISENLGHSVLLNFFTGKYHQPKFETRVFMFLDMKDSTTIAENLGHVQYFNFLKEYYAMMSNPIINHSGDVYQYIGDEVVISWKEKDAFHQNNCIEVFASIKMNLAKNENKFREKYGLIPDFKAGVHIGEVTVGEVGALKKEIVFSGDVLNTTARIQGLCKDYNEDLIISEELLSKFDNQRPISSNALGELTLRGKSCVTKIHAVNFNLSDPVTS